MTLKRRSIFAMLCALPAALFAKPKESRFVVLQHYPETHLHNWLPCEYQKAADNISDNIAEVWERTPNQMLAQASSQELADRYLPEK